MVGGSGAPGPSTAGEWALVDDGNGGFGLLDAVQTGLGIYEVADNPIYVELTGEQVAAFQRGPQKLLTTVVMVMVDLVFMKRIILYQLMQHFFLTGR